jgi:hypothetical protein
MVQRPDITEVKSGTEKWSKLEEDLLAVCPLGRPAYLPGKEGLPPDTTDPDRRLRAGLIRYLMLGGCDGEGGARPHPKGVQIKGGWIDGVLDLEGCETPLVFGLYDCLLPACPNLQDARIGALFLPGCAAPQGLNLVRLTTRGDVHLRKGFEAGATVNLVGARIGGQLACHGGRFLAPDGRALNCQAARIGASVFLWKGFEAQEKVDFVRADIGGNLRVEDAVLGAGIDLESTRIGHGFFWRKVTGARRVVDLTDARVGPLRDDRASWDGVGRLILDGFRYERIDGEMSVTDRIAWLGRARHRPRPHAPGAPDYLSGEDFNPQPHLRLAEVLRAQGDRNGAARVLVDREMRQRRASWWRAHARLDGTWRAGWLSMQEDFKRPLDFLFWLLAGYGHRPMRALFVSILLVILAAMLAGAAFDAGQFVPNSAVILTSVSWQEAIAAAGPGGKPLPLWLAHAPEAADYETFNRWLYGLDLFLPLDALGQEAAWRPRTGEWLGNLAFYSRTFFQAAGWIITALAAAVLTGLVGRRD